MRLSWRSNIEKLSDRELISRFQKTEDNRFVGVLYKRYAHLVFGVGLKYLKNEEQAKDMSMQVFEKLIDKLKTQSIDNFKSWLHVMTKNECLMALRKVSTRAHMQVVSLEEHHIMENESGLHLDREDVLESDLSHLETCIGNLKNEQQQCIRLFYLQKKSYQEIVSLTGIELKKVKSHIQNGRRNLKICVEKLREQTA